MSLQIPLAPLAARVGGDVGELPEAAEAGVGVQGSFDCSAQDDKMYADTIYFLAVFFEPRRDSWTKLSTSPWRTMRPQRLEPL
ncbi:MAG: hypothetical protein WA416_13755 [Candidatus Sulfotelmatobacter sp.]